MNTKVIDANMYWMPEALFSDKKLQDAFLRAIPRQYDVNAYFEMVGNTQRLQAVIEKPKGCQSLNYVQGDYVLEKQLKDMDEAGVDMAILKLPGCQEWLTLDLCRQFNDAMAEHCKKTGGRMQALGVVPPWGTEDCLEEMERCVEALGFSGFQASAHYGQTYLDDGVFRPFLKKLNALKLPLYVHHTPLPVDYDALSGYNNLRRSYGRCVDQTTAVSREVMSDLFKELPDLKLIHSMLGGAYFSYMSLMFPKMPQLKEEVARFKTDNERYLEYLNKNIYFEMSHAKPWGKVQLEAAVEIMGADHILFGSSYPVRRDWLIEGADFVNGLEISAQAKQLILGENAQRIYKI